MRYFVIGDDDTVLGFRYAGVPGWAVASPAEAREALRRAAEDRELGIVIVQEDIADSIRAEVDRVRFGGRLPLVVEAPGRPGPSPKRRELMDVIQEAVGFRL